ncbi:MAG: glucans biosynthesis glucosyltransferase MdoH [Gammaproteobacteria bacterium]
MDTGLAGTGFRALPGESPLVMPVQSLSRAPGKLRRLPSSPVGMVWRRLAVIGGALAMTVFAAREMHLVLAANGITPLAVIILMLFLPLFAWIALSFTSALAGFASMLAGGGRWPVQEGRQPTGRTALLMPCYNEQPARVMAGLAAIHESLRATGSGDRFDIFILSDTTDPDTWIAEEAAFLALRVRAAEAPCVFYRHRPKNTARKAGNIADWVMRFGGAYPQFLILDADSVMDGALLVRLAAAVEANPGVGLIQTLPVITGGATLFARLQQFAGRIYGPLIAHGLAWWHGAEGNYWGHNAMIRTQAFAEQAGLPDLSGRKPFGGHILSHDFVEAALIRRGNWAVHMVPALAGSYEQGPPSLADLALRDRRWCQGNLQHAAVLPARGLHWVSRLHLLTGIGSYVTAPLWLLFLFAGILVAVQARFVTPDYFPEGGRSLFPQWPVIDPVRAMWVFIATMGLLLAPKLLGAITILLRREDRRGCGGTLCLLVGMLVETVIAGLLAPVAMITQTVDVVSILLGRDSGWNAQRRDDGSVPLRDTIRLYRRHMILGFAMGSAAYAVSLYLALWMLPVVLGLTLAIPLAAITARRDVGLAFRRRGLLRTPEESSPPAVLARAEALYRAAAREQQEGGLARLLCDPVLMDAHQQMLPPPRRKGIDPLDVPLLVGQTKLEEAPTLAEGWGALTQAERMACLSNATALKQLAALPI